MSRLRCSVLMRQVLVIYNLGDIIYLLVYRITLLWQLSRPRPRQWFHKQHRVFFKTQATRRLEQMLQLELADLLLRQYLLSLRVRTLLIRTRFVSDTKTVKRPFYLCAMPLEIENKSYFQNGQ